MPFVTPKGASSTSGGSGASAGAGARTTFRPPWVKDDAASSTKPNQTVPWAKKTTTTNAEKENGDKPTTAAAKKATTKAAEETKTPAKTTGSTLKKTVEPVKKVVEPAAKKLVTTAAKKAAEPTTPVKKPLATNSKTTPTTTTAPSKTTTIAAGKKKKEPTPPPSSSSEEEETEEEETEEEDEIDAEDFSFSDISEPINQPFKDGPILKPVPKQPIKQKEIPAPPALPSLVPKAPGPPPPPPPLGAPGDPKKPLTSTQKAVIDKLRSRPRRRPDWSEMMKEVESGKKLRHVQCNDRSQPILTCKSVTKVDNKFIYETEKANEHNKLLKQIQGGIRLKPTKTNDRSKPFIEGLRKFRRQMTIEEQLQKSQSKINMLGDAPPGKDGVSATGRPSLVPALSVDEESSADELDDIDKLRDDLQSTKQMLALELRNREAQERENKKLLAKITTLEAELEREKSREKNLEYGSNVIIATMDVQPHSEEIYLKSLKEEAEGARTTAKELESKYLNTGELLDQAKLEIEEQKRQIQMLEKKLAQALQGDMTPHAPQKFNFYYAYEDSDDSETFLGGVNGTALNNHNNHKGGSLNGSRRTSDANAGLDGASDIDIELSESDPDEPEEKKAERRERRAGKEVKVLRSKLTKIKVKHEAAKKEKQALKQAMKKNHIILKEENKKFKKLEKEVQKMAASMKGEDEDGEEKDEDEEEEEPAEAEEEQEEEESEESEESESEESEAETESESEPEDATNAAKKENLEPRVKKHEGRFTAMKKCNVLLQANVDNLQDEITQVRAKAANLQSELDAVLADLGF